jgi:hypothetical protein
MAWALKQELVTDSVARHVLLCLANYAGQDGCAAFPSVATLMADTRLSERSVRAKLDHLLDLGVLRLGNQAIGAAYIERKDRRPTVYDIAIERGASPAPRLIVDNSVDKKENGVHLVQERGAPPAPRLIVDNSVDKKENGVHLVQERGAPPAPNTRALILKERREPVDKSRKRKSPSETAGRLAALNDEFFKVTKP